MILLKKKIISRFLSFLLSASISGISFSQEKIIFDTDFGGDADDLGALVMLHYYIDSNECDLLAVMCWSTEKYAIPAIDAVNRYYKHPDIPLAIRSWDVDYRKWNYNEIIANNFPHKLKHNDVRITTDLYREILSQQEDKSVTIVTVGPLKNIEELLKSQKDQHSDLSGYELLHKKVKRFVIMGGKFPSGEDEWNFDGGMPGVTRYVLENLKVPVIFSGFELGVQIKTGAVLNDLEKNTPLYMGFKHFSANAPWMKEYYKGKILDNSSYDQTAVLFAVEGGIGKYWDLEKNGKCVVNAEGDSKWVEEKNSNHSYLVLKEDPEKMAEIIEDRMLGNK